MEQHMTGTCVTTLLMMLAASAAHADLRYVTRVEVRPLQTDAPLEGMAKLASSMILSQLPRGESVTFINDVGARVDIRSAGGSMRKEGTVLLVRDAAVFIVDAASRTYWTPPQLPPLLFTPGLDPGV